MSFLSGDSEKANLTAEGRAVENIVKRLSQQGACDVAGEIQRAMAGLDINAPYSTSAGGEGDAAAVRGAEVMTMTAGHKLSLELVQHPHTPAAAKMEGVNAALGCGLDANARWCEGRASGIVGATLLASVLWLQGVSDEAKLELACALIEQGMDVNSQSIERATKATSGTFVLAGAMASAGLQSEAKAKLLSLFIDAGLDLNAPCQQAKQASTTGSTVATRIAVTPEINGNHQITMLTALVKGGWRPLPLSATDSTKLEAQMSRLARLERESVDPALLSALRLLIAQCGANGDWAWASSLEPATTHPTPAEGDSLAEGDVVAEEG
mmetsp:Transcript_92646/g.149566  ORF Transcript_92646/g.149566 Transcript_92646/m.149566 type:complete len:325 (+) Transcript_92646:58-1032(+)